MEISSSDLIKARENASAILQQLNLDAYIYDVEPNKNTWLLTIECACAIDGGWQTVTLQIPRQILIDGFDDEGVQSDLMDFWKKKLSTCKLRR